MLRDRLTDYWRRYYIDREHALCSLCGNHGTLDTTHVRSPAGVACGRINFCICPNGQALRKLAEDV